MTEQEINEAVAKKLGIKLYYPHASHPNGDCGKFECPCAHEKPKDYCHSIEAAWEIVETVSKAHTFNLAYNKIYKKFYFDILSDEDQGSDLFSVTNQVAATAPMAICLAFLKIEGKG